MRRTYGDGQRRIPPMHLNGHGDRQIGDSCVLRCSCQNSLREVRFVEKHGFRPGAILAQERGRRRLLQINVDREPDKMFHRPNCGETAASHALRPHILLYDSKYCRYQVFQQTKTPTRSSSVEPPI